MNVKKFCLDVTPARGGQDLGQGTRPLNLGTMLFAIFLFILAFGLVPDQDIWDYETSKKTGKKTLT